MVAGAKSILVLACEKPAELDFCAFCIKTLPPSGDEPIT
jgi:hypothetical protein